MLMIEKEDNLQTLSALGSTNTQIRRIFILEDMLTLELLTFLFLSYKNNSCSMCLFYY